MLTFSSWIRGYFACGALAWVETCHEEHRYRFNRYPHCSRTEARGLGRDAKVLVRHCDRKRLQFSDWAFRVFFVLFVCLVCLLGLACLFGGAVSQQRITDQVVVSIWAQFELSILTNLTFRFTRPYGPVSVLVPVIQIQQKCTGLDASLLAGSPHRDWNFNTLIPLFRTQFYSFAAKLEGK